MEGVKYDNGKPEPRLVLGTMSRAIMAVSEVATFGAKKYSADNWLKVDDALDRYTDAKDRHRLLGAQEETDADSGLLHAAHEAWNALAVLELMLRQKPVSGGKHHSNEHNANWPTTAEGRMDIIGQNGPTAEHYGSDVNND